MNNFERQKTILAGMAAVIGLYVFTAVLAEALFYSPEEKSEKFLSFSEASPESSGFFPLSPPIPQNSSSPVSSISSAVKNDRKNEVSGTAIKHPVRIIIPSISLDADIRPVGLDADGNMATASFWETGWYKYGSSPGEEGSAVIAGHVNNALSLPGVFGRLNEIGEGADIYIITEGGENLHFKAIRSDYYGYRDAPVEEIFKKSGSPLLRLITCGGEWVWEDRTYNKRLVVTAEMRE